MNKLFLVKVLSDSKETHVSIGDVTRKGALLRAVDHVGGGIANVLAVKKPEIGQVFNPKLIEPKIIKVVDRELDKAERRQRVAKRLQEEEQARQARATDHKNHVGPKGMSGQKSGMNTNPNSRKAKKAARLAANRK